jgi:hypothetical protein
MLAVACHHGSARPKPPPSCAEAAAHVFSLLEPKDEHAKDVRAVFDHRCTDDKWTPDVRTCVLSTVSLKDPKHCKQRLPISQRSRLDADLSDAGARARDRDVPPGCRAYTKVVDRMMECDHLPREARDALRKSARPDTEDACKVAADAMRQAAIALGCDVL